QPSFDNGSNILENWVEGNRYVLQESPEVNLLGTYEIANNNLTLEVEGTTQKYKARQKRQSEKVADAQLTVDGRIFTIRYTPENTKEPINVQGYISHDTPKRLIGKNFHKDGTTSNWSAKQVENATAKTDTKAKDSKTPEIG